MRELFGKWMHASGAKFEKRHNQPVGEHLVDREETDFFGNTRHHRAAALIEQSRAPGYVLGPLGLARQEFCRFTGLSIDWEDAP